MNEYKGIYYNNDSEHQYYEGGAHFKYKELFKILEEISKKVNSKKIPKNSKNVSISLIFKKYRIIRLLCAQEIIKVI